MRLQNDVVVPAVGPFQEAPCRRDRSSSQKSSGSARGRADSTSVGSSRRVPVEVEPDDSNCGDEEERLYSDVVQNLRRASRAENQDEAKAVGVDEDNAAMGEDEDVPAVEWDRENPQMEEGSIFSSMSECRNALVTYCIKAERTFEVDKSDKIRYKVHCSSKNCRWRMHASKMRNSMNIQVKVNLFRHTCRNQHLGRKQSLEPSQDGWLKK